MAAEIKMFNRCLHPCIVKFAVQTRFYNRPLNFMQTSRRSRCDYNFPKSFDSNSHYLYTNNIIQHVDHAINANQNLLGQDCKSITHTVMPQGAGDFTQYAKYLNPISRVNSGHQLIKPDNNISSFFDKASPDLNFTPIGPQKSEEENLLQSDKKPFDYLKGLPKTLFRRRKNDEKKPKKRIPKLILIQNPFTWLMIKIDFSVLRNIWDPSFTEKEFKYGTKQAISRVTNVISGGQYSELNGLLTKAARLSLMRELDRNWPEKQRSLLALQNEDIQISSPRKVYFIRIADKKYCDVDMAFLALKWAPINSIEALIFTEIFARFHREYTPHCIPEWTIAYFKVTRFEVLRRKPKTT